MLTSLKPCSTNILATSLEVDLPYLSNPASIDTQLICFKVATPPIKPLVRDLRHPFLVVLVTEVLDYQRKNPK